MSKHRSWDRRVVMAIEACRPGSDDASDPALGRLAACLDADPDLEDLGQRLQKLDATIAGAIQDVSVPFGLKGRLLAKLNAAGEAARSVSPRRPVLVPRHVQLGRLAWVPSLAGMAAAAVILVVGFLYQQSTQYSPATVMERGVELFNRDLRQPGPQWRDGLVPRYPFSGSVRMCSDVRWRPVEGLLDAPGLAYRMDVNGLVAVLYVLARPVAGLPAAPPLRPARSTADCSTSAWQENGLMYVLVVQGDWRAYQLFLDLPLGPVA